MAYGLIEEPVSGVGLDPHQPLGTDPLNPQQPQVGLGQDPANNNTPESAGKTPTPLTLAGYSQGLWTKEANGQQVVMDNTTGLFDKNGNSIAAQAQGVGNSATPANTTTDALGNPVATQEKQTPEEKRAALEAAALQLANHQDFHDDRNPEASKIVAKIVKEDITDGNSVSTLKLKTDVAALASLTGASLAKLGVVAEDIPPTDYVGMGIPRADPITHTTQAAHDMAQIAKAQANEASLTPPRRANG